MPVWTISAAASSSSSPRRGSNSVLYGDFAPQALRHQMAHGLRVVFVMALEKHQFGDGGLDGLILAADDTGFLKMVSAVVAAHLNGTLHTLADVDDHLAVFCTFAKGIEQPGTLGGIARAEGAHHDGLQVRGVYNMADQVFADAGEEREDDDVVVEAEMRGHWLAPVGREDAVTVIGDVHAGLDEVGVVERLKGVELLGALFGGTVATQQMASEIDAHLGYEGMPFLILRSSDLYGGNQVFLAIGAQLTDRQLGACEDDRLCQVLEHVGEGRGGIGHRIRTMQHHETVVTVVVVGDTMGDIRPAGRGHVAGVDGGRELEGVDLRVELLEFGYVDDEMLEIEGFEGTRLGVAVHADGAAGVNQ